MLQMVTLDISVCTIGDLNFQRVQIILSIYKLNNEHELVDEFKNLGSEHSNFVNDWTSEKIIVSTYAHVESFLKMLI